MSAVAPNDSPRPAAPTLPSCNRLPSGPGIRRHDPQPADAPCPTWRARLIVLAKLGAATGLLVWLIGCGRLQVAHLMSVPLSRQLVLFAGLALASLALPCWRWWWLLRIQGLHEPFWKVVALTWAGYFAALLMPGAAGGDLAKGYLILRQRP